MGGTWHAQLQAARAEELRKDAHIRLAHHQHAAASSSSSNGNGSSSESCTHFGLTNSEMTPPVRASCVTYGSSRSTSWLMLPGYGEKPEAWCGQWWRGSQPYGNTVRRAGTWAQVDVLHTTGAPCAGYGVPAQVHG